MPKARTPLDMERIAALQRQGLSRRQIAQELGMAESTLRENLRAMQKAQASHGPPQGDQGPPQGDEGGPLGPRHVYQSTPQGPPQGDHGLRPPDVSLGPPQSDQAATTVLAGRDLPAPHRGGPENTEGGPQGSHEVRLGRPLPEGDLGGPLALLSTQDLQDLQALLAWWRDRQHLVQDAAAPERQLERQTYHIEKRFIEAVRREADRTGESYAAIVNRAFAQYFAGKST